MKKLKGEEVWIDLEERVYYGKKRSVRSKSGFFTKSLASAIRRSVRDALSPRSPKTRISSSPYSSTYSKNRKQKQAKTPYRSMTIDEMPEELRYLSYPHLKPKPAAFQKSGKVTPEVHVPDVSSRITIASLRELAGIIGLFFIDLWNGKPKS